jgi:hypothetical protein
MEFYRAGLAAASAMRICISSHVRYASDRYRNGEPLKPTRRANERHQFSLDDLVGYSITLSARTNNASGTVTPIALAVFRLITSSNLVGCSTGMSATLLPRKSWTICRALISFQAD